MGLATIKQWRIDWKRSHELLALGPDERDALARDIGISGDVLGRLGARGPEAGTELPRLIRCSRGAAAAPGEGCWLSRAMRSRSPAHLWHHREDAR